MHPLRPAIAGLLSGVSLLASTAVPASMAFSVAGSDTSTSSGTPGQQTLNFLQFDSALGTLTGVTFTLNSQNVNIGSTIGGSFTGGEGGTASGLTTGVFDIDGPGGLQLFLGNGSATSTCESFNDTPCNGSIGPTTLPVFAPLVLTFSAPPTDLSPFIGNGSSFFDVFVELDVNAGVSGCAVAPGSAGSAICSATGSAGWAGTVDVTYDYTPKTSVPEPATVALLGLGLAGLGFSRRRR